MTSKIPTSDEYIVSLLNEINPLEYAKRRNFLGGGTKISPYITHGFITPREVRDYVAKHFDFDDQNKFVQELAWREFFAHYALTKPEALNHSVRKTLIDENYYKKSIPADIKYGVTGIPVIDQSVEELYRTGYLHNHSRMWLSSYMVHYRKVSWQVGAAWMYSHLLDGDLASNNLSWQWIAGTLTGKPYIFNAENVKKYAPSLNSDGTRLDETYALLNDIARSPNSIEPEPKNRRAPCKIPKIITNLTELELEFRSDLPRKSDLTICHPWDLTKKSGKFDVCVIIKDYHHAHPWNLKRWKFVYSRIRTIATTVAAISKKQIYPAFKGKKVRTSSPVKPFYEDLLEIPNISIINRDLLHRVEHKHYPSFSKYWKAVKKTPKATNHKMN